MQNRWIMVVGSLLITLVAVALMGCATPPQAELDAGQAALQEAKSAEAVKYAEAEWSRAQSALEAAQAEIEAQNQRFVLMRDYEAARQMLADASARASEARDAAVAGKQAAREEAELAQVEAAAAVEQARQLLGELTSCGRGVKGFAADMAALQGSLDGLAAEMPAVEAAVTQEDFDGAEARGSALKMLAETLTQDLENARQKLGCRPKA